MRMSLRPRVNSQRQLMINYISIVAKLDRNPNCFRYIYIIYTHIRTHKIFYVWRKERFLLCGVWIFGVSLRECECTFLFPTLNLALYDSSGMSFFFCVIAKFFHLKKALHFYFLVFFWNPYFFLPFRPNPWGCDLFSRWWFCFVFCFSKDGGFFFFFFISPKGDHCSNIVGIIA